MTSLVGLLVVVPMLAAAIGFVAGERQWVRDILTVGSLAGATAIAGILLATSSPRERSCSAATGIPNSASSSSSI